VFKRILYKDIYLHNIMLFRTNNGKLLEIKKNSFINDKLYYEKLLCINKPLPKLEKTFTNKNNK